jgi:N-acetylglucosaminyl-diphospho-decaprenol L-rhamnosyltransferase
MPPASVDIVIVNWNTGQGLRECLASIAGSSAVSDPGAAGASVRSVRVVDNASVDGSASDLDGRGLALTVIHNRENLGFARACNQGAAGHSADYLLFLNPDVILGRDALRAGVATLRRMEDVGFRICGVKLLYPDGRVFPSCARFPSPRTLVGRALGLDRLGLGWFPAPFLPPQEHAGTRQVDQVTGAFFLLTGAVFDLLGGFDERFFVYYEELDFALRARHSGIKSLFTDKAEATHVGGLSSSRVVSERTFYSLRSRVLYSYKHFGRGGGDAVLASVLVAEPVLRLVRAIASLRWSNLVAVIRATRLLWGAMPEFRAARATSASARLPSTPGGG